MEQTDHSPLDAAETWARLEAGFFDQSRRLFRQASQVALAAVCHSPGQRGLIRFTHLVNLVLFFGCLAAGLSMVGQGIRPALWMCALPYITFFLALINPLALALALRLHANLHHFEGAVLYPTHLHLENDDGGSDYPLDDLTRVYRGIGWTVLLWQGEETLLALPVPDTACSEGGEALLANLRQTAPQAIYGAFHRSWPRQVKIYLLWGLYFLVTVLSASAFQTARDGLQLIISPNWEGGAAISLAYDHQKGTLSFAEETTVPVTGEVKIQWQTATCCAVTYQSPDGQTHVQLLDGASGRGDRLQSDPITGSWQQNAFFWDPGITLQWDSDAGCYRLLTGGGESVYRQWQSFDGLGIALCNSEGLPEWTLTATHIATWKADGSYGDCEALVLSPVSLDDTDERVWLHPSEDTDTAASAS